mmetsp:Transcript_25439/g.83691  ORF Transcript_25439/g.83691 Transcript_25439/m.83691 type:complete len:134 (-) Transcript_25439:298-699(-)
MSSSIASSTSSRPRPLQSHPLLLLLLLPLLHLLLRIHSCARVDPARRPASSALAAGWSRGTCPSDRAFTPQRGFFGQCSPPSPAPSFLRLLVPALFLTAAPIASHCHGAPAEALACESTCAALQCARSSFGAR